jgi:CRP-like cAMP-binding protein
LAIVKEKQLLSSAVRERMYEQLFQYFEQRTQVTKEAFETIKPYFKKIQTKRNQFLLRNGEVCRHYYFVNHGCLRLFTINAEGQENTRYFAFEGAFGTALPSLINQKPAFEFVQTIEKSELLVIGRDDFYTLVDTFPPMAKVYRLILEASFITAQQRIYGFQGSDALEKVRWVQQYNPQLLTRISNKMAASFLGMNPSTLSRLKSKL